MILVKYGNGTDKYESCVWLSHVLLLEFTLLKTLYSSGLDEIMLIFWAQLYCS